MFLSGNSLFEKKNIAIPDRTTQKIQLKLNINTISNILDGLKTKEISTYSRTSFPLQAPGAKQGRLSMMPSTNIKERNRAKTQSAVVFISLTKVSVNEKFWYIY